MKILQNIFRSISSHTFMLEVLHIINSHKHPFEKRLINLILQMTKQTQSDYILCLSHRPCVWSTLTLKPGLPHSKASYFLTKYNRLQILELLTTI